MLQNEQQLLSQVIPYRTPLSKQYQKIEVLSNMYMLNMENQHTIGYQYSIEVFPELEKGNHDALKDILYKSKETFLNAGIKEYWIRGWNLWSLEKVDQPIIGKGIDKFTNKEHNFKVIYSSQYDTRNLIALDSKVVNPIIQSQNVLLKRALEKLKFLQYARKYYYPQEIKLQQVQLSIFKGVAPYVQVVNGQIYITIHLFYKIMRDETVLDIINTHRKTQFKHLRKALENKVVMAKYGNRKTYRIQDVDFKQNPLSSFKQRDGSQITFEEYYRKHYGIQIQDKKQPLIIVSDKKQKNNGVYLIPELMQMTGIEKFNEKLEVEQYTKPTPQEKYKEIQSLREQLNFILPNITQNNKREAFLLDKPKMIKNQDKVSINNWFFVYKSLCNQDDDQADDIVDILIQSGKKYKIIVDKPIFVTTNNSNPDDWIQRIKKKIQEEGKPQIILAFIPERDSDILYSPIKEYCFNQIGVPSQVFLDKKKRKKLQQILAKVLLQMKVKLGISLRSAQIPQDIPQNILIIGIDTFHKLIQNKNSCLAFIAHMNNCPDQFFSSYLIQRPGQEMSSLLGGVMNKALNYFKKQQGKYPDHVVIYRDGVGMGSINDLLQIEVQEMKAAIGSLCAAKLSVLLVCKRINEKFFTMKHENPSEGTVVSFLESKFPFDFYLIAQKVPQGTATPINVTVLVNESNWAEDLFWKLTYNQCYNYQNWDDSIKVPNCCQLAHKLAYLIGETYQRGETHINLQGTQYFI